MYVTELSGNIRAGQRARWHWLDPRGRASEALVTPAGQGQPGCGRRCGRGGARGLTRQWLNMDWPATGGPGGGGGRGEEEGQEEGRRQEEEEEDCRGPGPAGGSTSRRERDPLLEKEEHHWREREPPLAVVTTVMAQDPGVLSSCCTTPEHKGPSASLSNLSNTYLYVF